MHAKVFALSAAACLMAATSVQARQDDLQRYAWRAQVRADALLRAAGIDPKSQTVAIAARIDPDGRVTDVSIVRSSGSRGTDLAVEAVLRKVVGIEAPLGLEDGTVILNLGKGLMLAALEPLARTP